MNLDRLSLLFFMVLVKAMYEFFDHTADLGIRVQAPDPTTLFIEAGEALMAAVVEDLTQIEPRESRSIALTGDELDYLLFDWLRELLYLVDTHHLMLRRFEVQLRDGGLQATVWGEPLDRTRHALAHEVKAITYHGLKLEQEDGQWVAEMIVDI